MKKKKRLKELLERLQRVEADRIEAWPRMLSKRDAEIKFEMYHKGALKKSFQILVPLRPQQVPLERIFILSDGETFLFDSKKGLSLSRGLFTAEAAARTLLIDNFFRTNL